MAHLGKSCNITAEGNEILESWCRKPPKDPKDRDDTCATQAGCWCCTLRRSHIAYHMLSWSSKVGQIVPEAVTVISCLLWICKFLDINWDQLRPYSTMAGDADYDSVWSTSWRIRTAAEQLLNSWKFRVCRVKRLQETPRDFKGTCLRLLLRRELAWASK